MFCLQTVPQYQSAGPSLSRAQYFVPALRLLLIGFLALVPAGGLTRAETPTEAVDRLWKAAFDANGVFYSSTGIWILSKSIAHDQGVSVIPPIMVRSKEWKSEEVLIFVPLVYFLPSTKAIPILKQYEKTGKPWEKQCAIDLLYEITEHPDDLKEMEKQLSKG